MFHNVRARVTTRVLCGTHLHLISNVIYLACDGRGSCLPELVVVCTNQSGSRDARALDPLRKSAMCTGNVGLNILDLLVGVLSEPTVFFPILE